MTINEKLIKYVEFIGISQRKFTSDCGLAEGALRGSKSIGGDKFIRIKRIHPDLNMNWLLFDEGNMLLTGRNEVNEHPETYQNDSAAVEILKKEVESLKSLLEAKNETIDILKHQTGIKSNENKQSKAS